MNKYQFLSSTPAKSQWQKIGLKRRAGVIFPLFSVYSKESFGIGDILDLKKVIDLCKICGFSILQLLPLNDTGFNYFPYSIQSSFAIDPMYLSLTAFQGKSFNGTKETRIKKNNFTENNLYIDYKIKGEKLRILWEIFLKEDIEDKNFKNFQRENSYWLNDFCLYRVLKQNFQEKSWENWEKQFRTPGEKIIKDFAQKHFQEINFQAWLQWQIFKQFKEVKNYAQKRGVLLAGDLPWLVSFDSADAWSHKEFFDLKHSAGVPPDAFSETGQRWWLAPINWQKIFDDDFLYFKEKLKYAQNFYDLFRIDHVLGIFRVWKIKREEPEENRGLQGFFEPADENLWEEQGRKILKEFIRNTTMLPIAEDLGMIPACCPKVLKELGVLGMKVQRWAKHYPLNSVATLSTHDISNWPAYFKTQFNRYPTKQEIENNLKEISKTDSIFSINLIFEWLFLDEKIKDYEVYRINVPGVVSEKNWRIRLPISLEELLRWQKDKKIREINAASSRVSDKI